MSIHTINNQNEDPLLERNLAAMVNIIDLSQELAAARNMETIMNIVRIGARNLTGADGATFVLRDGEFCYYADESAIKPLWKGSRFLMTECISGWAMLNHETVIIPDIFQDGRIPKSVYEPTFVKSIVMVPIRSSNPLGAIGCYWADYHTASSTEVYQLQILANMTAIAIENCNHLIEIESKAQQLEKAFEGTLISISRMIDLSDAYTSGHQNRVSALAYQIGQSMGLPSDHCQILKWVGLVHDAGKIAVPTEVLSKPSSLSLTEFKLVQTHSRMGHYILKDVEMDYPIADVVLQHHERLNGSGYPDGLVADQILPDAKILAVADVFEAMVSHRPYRPAHSYEDALSELRKNSGILYDTMIVNTLARLVIDEKYVIT